MPDLLAEKIALLRSATPPHEANVDEFLGLVSEVVDLGEVRAVPMLLETLDDNCQLSGVMDAVSRSLEEFPLEGYVKELLLALPEFNERSPFWCDNEIRKLLWAPDSRDALMNGVEDATSAVRATLRSTLEQIAAETPELAEACREIEANLGP